MCLLLVMTSSGYAQRMTPLHHLMVTHSLLERPEEFRALQEKLNTLWASKPEKVRLDFLRDHIRKLRQDIVAQMDVRVSFTGNTLSLTIGSLSPISYSFRQDTTFEGDMEKLVNQITVKLDELFDEGIDKLEVAEFRPQLKTAILLGLTQAIDTTGGVSPTRYLVRIIVQRFSTGLLRAVKQSNPVFDMQNKDAWKKNTISLQLLQEEFPAGMAQARQILERSLSDVEEILLSAVADVEEFFGAAGISLADAQGDLGGGVVWRPLQWFQMYLNGSFDPTLARAPEGILGVQVRPLLWGVIELDFMGSFIMEGKAGDFELGLGFSFNPVDNLIVGIAGYGRLRYDPLALDRFPKLNERIKPYSLGLTLKGTSPSSPVLLIGICRNIGRPIDPLFQISYPLTEAVTPD